MKPRTNSRLVLVAFAFCAVVLVGGLAMVAGAQTVDTELTNTTVAVDNDTQSVYVDIGNTTENTTATFYGIDNGTETEVYNQTLQPVANGSIETVSTTAKPGTYDSYRVVVMGNSSDDGSAEIAVGTIDKNEAGSGDGGAGFLDGYSNTQKALGVLVLAGVVLLLRE